MPLLPLRCPGTVNFKVELAAEALLVMLAAVTKVFCSVSVGTLKPTGQGLFALACVAQRVSSFVLLQSILLVINDAWVGVLFKVPVVPFGTVPVVPFVQVINSCPSGFLPH